MQQMLPVFAINPALYSRNGYECIDAIEDSRDGTLVLIMWRTYGFSNTKRLYVVWVGANAVTGVSPYPELTKQFTNKQDADAYARKGKR